MKFTLLTTAALFTTAVLAGNPDDEHHPHPPPPPPHHHPDSVQVQLANDQTGANANAKVPTDGHPRPIEVLWGHTAVSTKGVVKASSAQLTKFEKDDKCKILQKHPHVDAELDARRTWTWLAGGKPVELKDGVIICHD